MITPTAAFSTANSIKERTPIFRAKFATVAQEFSTHPIKTNYPGEISADGPIVGYWRFGDVGGGPAVDSSGNGLDGTYQNSPTQAVPGALVGDSDYSVQFYGAEWVTVPDNVFLDPGDAFTLDGWVNRQASSDYYSIFDKGANGYQLLVTSNGLLTLAKSGVANIAQATVTIPLDTWTHVAATKNGPSVHLYVNGKDVTGSVSNQTIVATAADLMIAQDYAGIYALAALDELVIYSRDLSAARIQAHYDAGRMLLNRRGVLQLMGLPNWSAAQVIPERGQSSMGTFSFGLLDVANYDSEVAADNPSEYLIFGELKGTTAVDSSGNALDGSYTGAPQIGQIGPLCYGDAPDYAVLFNGVNQYVTVPDNNALDPGNILTLELWVKPTSLPFASRVILDKGANGYQVSIAFTGTVTFAKSGGVTIADSGGAVVSVGVWNHVVITKSGSTTHIYVNRTESTALGTDATIVATASALTIGKAGSSFFPGAVSRFALYPTALSAARIEAHYDAMFRRPADSLNGVITRLVGNGVKGLSVTASRGYDDIREADYISEPVGIVDQCGLDQTLTRYQLVARDPQTLTNKSVFNVAAVPLTVAMGTGDTVAIVANATNIEAPGYAVIENEKVQFSGKIATGIQIPEQAWKSIAYGNGLYVAVAADGYVGISLDGKNWDRVTPSIELNTWNGIVWAAGLSLFVVVGSSGTHRVMTSPDGVNWTMQTAAEARSWMSVAWSSALGLLAAIAPGSPTRVMTSPDGVTWTAYGVPFVTGGTAANAITWSPDLGMFSAGNVYSTNGTTWNVLGPILAQPWWSICWSSDLAKLVAISNNGGLTSGHYADSTDGKNWAPQDTLPITNARSVCWSHEQLIFVAVANVSGITTNAVATSPDGITWTPRRTSTTTQSFLCVIWAAGISKFVAVGPNGASTNSVITSPDGINWTDRVVPYGQVWESVAWSPSLGRLVAVASGTGGTGTMVMTSSDGITWTARTEAESNQWRSVVWADTLGLFVAVADNGTHRVMTSPDGITWTARTAAEANSWGFVAWSTDLGKLVAVSIDGTHRVMTSPDGTTWTARTAAEANSWRSVVWAAGLSLFVAVSEDGNDRVMYSPDGATWTPDQPLPYLTWTGIVWADTLALLVAVTSTGFTNQVYTSPDGLAWTPRTAAEANGWTGLVWASALGILVAVAQSGTHRVMTSTNGTSWTAQAAAAANQWQAVTWSGSLFVVVANSGGGDRDMVSNNGFTWSLYQSLLNGLTRGVLGTTAATHAVGITFQEMIRLTGHMMDIALGVLKNSGKAGLSISSSLVDETQIAAIKTALGPECIGDFYIRAAANGKAWLESEICLVLGLYPVIRNGKYSFRQMQTFGSSDDTITHDDIKKDNGAPKIQWSDNYKNIINSITFLYEYDGSNFNNSAGGPDDTDFSDAASIAAGEFPLIIQSQGLRSTSGIQTIMKNVAAALLARYKNGAALVQMGLLAGKGLMEAGDVESVTTTTLPNKTTKTRGITFEKMEVISRGLPFNEGYVDVQMIWPN